MDLIVRVVHTGGSEQFLPIIVNEDGKELYRGAFQPTVADALSRCTIMMDQQNWWDDVKRPEYI